VEEKKKCLNCNKEITHHKKYCNNKCQNIFIRNSKVQDWLSGKDNGYNIKSGYPKGYIRTYLIQCANEQCTQCGWKERNTFTKQVPLDIHHKDGNRENCKPENLIVVCPNCHSLTCTYKGANK